MVSHNTPVLSEYDIPTGQWRTVEFVRREDDLNIVYLDGIYGIRWQPHGGFLYAAAIGGAAKIAANGDSITNTVVCQTAAASSQVPPLVWDVAVKQEYGEGVVDLIGTEDAFQAPYQPRLRFVGFYRYYQEGNCTSMRYADHPDTGGLLFGIEYAPDGTFWVTNYDRGILYQMAPDGSVLQQVSVGNLKVGLGLVVVPNCLSHNGDVNNDGCVDDADLLSILFMFGSTGQWIREDVNCDNSVDDADLLTVLFNFGQGC